MQQVVSELEQAKQNPGLATRQPTVNSVNSMSFSPVVLQSLLTMMTLGGSPTAVAVPPKTIHSQCPVFEFTAAAAPMLEKMTSASRIGIGSKPMTRHMLMVTGVSRRMVVTLSRKAETMPLVTRDDR